jgi:indole-3-glycerol phosphate synthase
MSFLDSILKVKNEEAADLRKKFSLKSFEESSFFGDPTFSLKDAIRKNNHIGIIAEIKKASPSKGLLKPDFNFMEIAALYMENRVDAISILTDKNFFQGDIKYLNQVAREKTIPLLRKDFIIDEYQIFEAKANGADAVLLIAEALSPQQIKELTLAAKGICLDVLLELHAEKQLDKIDFSLNDLIGINNRDLDTFVVDTNTSIKLSRIIPPNVMLISESGFNKKEDVKLISNTPIKALLIGEHFMRSENIQGSIKEVKEWCSYES